jgi:hypothetical protein
VSRCHKRCWRQPADGIRRRARGAIGLQLDCSALVESLDHIHVFILADPELGCTPRRYPDPDRGGSDTVLTVIMAKPSRLAASIA